MIYVTFLGGRRVMLNHKLIETIEETPDTVITTTTGKKYVVLERMHDLYQLINRLESSKDK